MGINCPCRFKIGEGCPLEYAIKHFDSLTPRELYEILRLRSKVFVVEQRCIYQDLDDYDLDCYHLWLRDEQGIAAYMRLLDKGKYPDSVSFGRIIAARRREGLGTEIVRRGIIEAKRLYSPDKIRIGAQLQAEEFYKTLGFVRCGEEYDEDGIIHVHMVLPLRKED